MATRPERRPGGQDRRGAARCRPVFPFGIGIKRQIDPICSSVTLPYLPTPVSPFHAEPLHCLNHLFSKSPACQRVAIKPFRFCSVLESQSCVRQRKAFLSAYRMGGMKTTGVERINDHP